MRSPENPLGNTELENSVTSKARSILEKGTLEREQHPSHDDYGWLGRLARSLKRERYIQRGSIQIGSGYEWVAIMQKSSTRHGSPIVESLTIHGDRMTDAEGRIIQRLWSFDVYNESYSTQQLEVLNNFFDAEDKSQLFQQLADLQQQKQVNQ